MLAESMAAPLSAAEAHAVKQSEPVQNLQSADGAVSSRSHKDMVQESSPEIMSENKKALIPTISNVSTNSARTSEAIASYHPTSEVQQITETYTAVSTTLQEIQKLQQFVSDIVPVVARLKEDKRRAEETVESQQVQLETCMAEIARLKATNSELHNAKILAQNVALHASQQHHSLRQELWDVRTVNNDLCLEIERLKEASENNACAVLEQAKVLEDLEVQKVRAADAEAERAEAVKLMIHEKDRTRRAEEACAKAEQDRDVAMRALQGERAAAFWKFLQKERQTEQLRNEQDILLQKLQNSKITRKEEFNQDSVEINAEVAQDTFTTHTDDDYDDVNDDVIHDDDVSQHSAQHDTLGKAVPPLMHGAMHDNCLQDALVAPNTSADVPTPRRIATRPLVPPLPLQSMSFNSSSSICKPSEVTFRLLKDFVVVPATPKTSAGTPLLQQTEKMSNGPSQVSTSVPPAPPKKKRGKAASVKRSGVFWNRLRRFTGVITACATHPQTQMYDRMR